MLLQLVLALIALTVAKDDHHHLNEWYNPDGGNNKHHHDWGTSGDRFIREHPKLQYEEDKYWEDSPRWISNVVSSAKHSLSSPRNISAFLTVWAQFIDHDIVYTEEGDEKYDSWPIKVPKCDPWFDKECSGDKKIPFTRSSREGKDIFNLNTAWIDASTIYGSSNKVMHALRKWKHGLLKVSKEFDEVFPPYRHELDEDDQKHLRVENPTKKVDDDKLFALGDGRGNQHPLLLGIHIVFWREHNRVAKILHKKHPSWDDEKLFHTARKYVIAEIQHVTFTEYLFWLLGGRDFPRDDYYDKETDPRIHVFFSTVAFRYGHSEVNNLIKKAHNGHYGDWVYSKLHGSYFDPHGVTDDDLASLFEGLAYQVQRFVDTQYADSIRNFLFGDDTHPKFDLMAIDIQRSRDHRIPSYNHVRKAYGLDPYDDWKSFESLNDKLGIDEEELKSKLSKVYRNPWDADPIIAGLAEDWVRTKETIKHHDYSNVGELFEAAIISQFQRIRTGDRFWYSRNLDEVSHWGDLESVEKRTLADIIRDNVKGVEIPDDVFKVYY